MTEHEANVQQESTGTVGGTSPEARSDADSGDSSVATKAQEGDAAAVGQEEQTKRELEKLDIDVEELDSIRRRFRIRIPAEEVQRLLDIQLEEYSRKIHLPGFRPGRARPSVVFKKFRTEFLEELKHFLVGQSLKKLVEDEYDFVDEPDLDVYALNPPEPGKDFEFEFTAEVQPSVELPDYKNLEVKRPEPELTEEDIEREVRQLMEAYGDYEEVDEPVQPRDRVELDLVVRDGDTELAAKEGVEVLVVDQIVFRDARIDSFADALVGRRKGETVHLKATVLPTAADPAWRNKTVDVEATIKRIERLQPDAMEAVLDLFDWRSEEEFREALESLLRRRLESEADRVIRRQVLEQLLERTSFDLPEDLIRRQQEILIRREVRRLQLAGYNEDQIRSEMALLRGHLLEQTELALRQHIVLSMIARAEGIKPTEEQIDDYIRQLAEATKANPRRLRARLEREGTLSEIEGEILEDLVIQRLMDYCKFVPAEEPLRLPQERANVDFVDLAVIPPPKEEPQPEKPSEGAEQEEQPPGEQEPEAARADEPETGD